MIKNNGVAFTRRQTLSFMALSSAAVVLPGVFTGPALAQQDGKPSGQIIVGFSQEPTVFHPHLPHVEIDEAVHFAIFDPLFFTDEQGQLQPALAKEVPTVENGGISQDGLEWRIKLRDDVKWHDGTPFTAEDVKFTPELQVDPAFRSWRRSGHDQVRDIQIVSPTEITWKMAAPYAPYSAILATTFIVPKHLLESAADKNASPFNNAPVGTGPFKWDTRVSGDRVELTANADYFGDGPYVERVVYRYIPDMTVLYTQFKTGDIDIIGLQWITADNYQEASTLPGRQVKIVPLGFVESLSLNVGKPQFQDPVVRQALYHAIDKQAIIDALYYGVPTPTESFIPQQSFYYNADLPKHEYNIAKANELLDNAGWVKGDDGIRTKDGVRLSFTNSTTAGNHLREQVQQYLQQSFTELGVEMKISNMPAAVVWGDYWMKSQFESVLISLYYQTGSDPDVTDYFSSTAIPAQGGAGQNTWQYKSADADRLMKEGGTNFVPEERRKFYLDLQAVVRQDLPFLPIFQSASVRGYKDGIDGISPNINTRIDTWNVRAWRRAGA